MTNIFLCCPHLLRYQVHQKLVGFMAPLEREGLTDTAKCVCWEVRELSLQENRCCSWGAYIVDMSLSEA